MPSSPKQLRVARWLFGGSRTWACGAVGSILGSARWKTPLGVVPSTNQDHWEPQRVCSNTRDLPGTNEEPTCTWGNERNTVKQRVNPKSKPTTPSHHVYDSNKSCNALGKQDVCFRDHHQTMNWFHVPKTTNSTRLQLPPVLKPVLFHHNWWAVQCWNGNIRQMHQQSLGAPSPVQGGHPQTPENDFPPLKSFLQTSC